MRRLHRSAVRQEIFVLVSITATTRVRRSRGLVIYYEGESLVFENFLLRTKTRSHPLLTDLLREAEHFKAVSDIKERFSGKTTEGWDETLEALVDQGILVCEGSDQDLRELQLDAWKWDLSARYYHFATKDVEFSTDYEGELPYFTNLAAVEPPPAHYKDYDSKFLALPPPLPLPERPLEEILRNRRTQRWFIPHVISQTIFSQLIFFTWGKLGSVDEGLISGRIFRTSPSGGCRHPIEVYPIINQVEGIPAGIYHYSVRRHGLELLEAGDFVDLVTKFCADQPWVRNASVFFVMSAIFPRSMWRYRFSRAYRVVQMDAGHLGQTFQLVSTCLGLDSFITAALRDTMIESTLGLDGIMESVIYAGAAGRVNDPVRL
jgi:SagB-type dehydrogenase family enzyme